MFVFQKNLGNVHQQTEQYRYLALNAVMKAYLLSPVVFQVTDQEERVVIGIALVNRSVVLVPTAVQSVQNHLTVFFITYSLTYVYYL